MQEKLTEKIEIIINNNKELEIVLFYILGICFAKFNYKISKKYSKTLYKRTNVLYNWNTN